MATTSKKGSFIDIINAEKPVLVDFYADWCGPCHTMAPVLEDVAQGLKDIVKVVKIDVDKNKAISAKYDIRSIPTIILFKKGEVLWKQAGVLSRADLESQIRKHLS